MSKDFWRSQKVAVIGGGSWGTVIAHLISQNAPEVSLWVRDDEVARAINSTRKNPKYVKNLELRENLKAYSEPERVFETKPKAVVWALPSSACRDRAKEFAKFFTGEELVMHATKGVEQGTLKRVSRILEEELPCRRIGVISGPNLAAEIANGEPAATVVASQFSEVIEAGEALLTTPDFRVYPAHDVVGVEWAGVLKNILAIATGSLDSLGLGWNARSMLISRGLAEMVRFGIAMGSEQSTFLSLAGIGDLLATCASPLSRNYRVGFHLAKGKKLAEVLEELGSTAEGVRTVKSVWDFACERKIEMPITGAVYHMVRDELSAQEAIKQLMLHPIIQDPARSASK